MQAGRGRTTNAGGDGWDDGGGSSKVSEINKRSLGKLLLILLCFYDMTSLPFAVPLSLQYRLRGNGDKGGMLVQVKWRGRPRESRTKSN